MNNKPFIINNRFWVNPQLAVIKENKSGDIIGLEPELINLLCILVMYNHEFVTAKQLAHQVWKYVGNDYRQLARGITALRETLGDTNHTIIKVEDQKGFMLQAVVKFDADRAESPKQAKV